MYTCCIDSLYIDMCECAIVRGCVSLLKCHRSPELPSPTQPPAAQSAVPGLGGWAEPCLPAPRKKEIAWLNALILVYD